MRKILLSQGQHAKVDNEDYEWLSQWNWTFMSHSSVDGYAYRKEGRKSVLMHRQILSAKKGDYCDHKNGSGLDNRRSNLRLCSQQQNSFNSRAKNRGGKTSKFKGVHWCETTQRWIAKVKVKGKVWARHCRTELAAARAYDELALKHHGKFAYTNFPNA